MPSVCCKCRQAIWRDASLAGYGLNPVLNKVYILVTEIIFLYRKNQCEETGRQVPQYVNNLSLMSLLTDFFLVPRNTQEFSCLILLLCILFMMPEGVQGSWFQNPRMWGAWSGLCFALIALKSALLIPLGWLGKILVFQSALWLE